MLEQELQRPLNPGRGICRRVFPPRFRHVSRRHLTHPGDGGERAHTLLRKRGVPRMDFHHAVWLAKRCADRSPGPGNRPCRHCCRGFPRNRAL